MALYGEPTMETVWSLYEKGSKPKIIAQVLDMPMYKVTAIIRAAKYNKPEFDKIVQLKKSGMTDTDIARAIGRSKQHVSRMTGKKQQAGPHAVNHNVMMQREEWRIIQEIAEGFGLIVEDGNHAGLGSVRKLLEGIARRDFIVERNDKVLEVLL